MSDIPQPGPPRTAPPEAGGARMISAVPSSRTAGGAPASEQAPARIGWSEARPSLEGIGGPIRPLEISRDILPELEEASESHRSLWRHPASLVSMGTTLAALIALAVLLILGVFRDDSPAASGLEIEVGDSALRASWNGPEVPYQAIVVGGPAGEALDVSQGITGTELWLPLAAGLVDTDSCLVVRPAEGNETAPVSLERSALENQGATAKCVFDVPAD